MDVSMTPEAVAAGMSAEGMELGSLALPLGPIPGLWLRLSGDPMWGSPRSSTA